MQWMKGGGWPFQSNSSIAKELVTFQYGDFYEGWGGETVSVSNLLIGW